MLDGDIERRYSQAEPGKPVPGGIQNRIAGNLPRCVTGSLLARLSADPADREHYWDGLRDAGKGDA